MDTVIILQNLQFVSQIMTLHFCEILSFSSPIRPDEEEEGREFEQRNKEVSVQQHHLKSSPGH